MIGIFVQSLMMLINFFEITSLKSRLWNYTCHMITSMYKYVGKIGSKYTKILIATCDFGNKGIF